MRLLFALFVVLAASASRAHAARDCSAQFRNEGQAIPAELIRRGYPNFGPLSMARLRQHINTVTVTPNDHLLGRMDLRSTARWSREGSRLKVEVDCGWYNSFPLRTRRVLAFHEYIWSFGVYDEIHWVSIGGQLLTESLTHQALRKNEIDEIRNWIGRIAAKSGGIVGVGGGGEIETVDCKLPPIFQALQGIKAAKTEDQRNAWLAKFEDYLTRDLNCISGHRLNRGPSR